MTPAADLLLQRLEASTAKLSAIRDEWRDCCTDEDGVYDDPEVFGALVSFDSLIEANRAAIARAREDAA